MLNALMFTNYLYFLEAPLIIPNCGVHMHVFLLGQEGGKKLNIGSEHILEMIRGDLKITILA